MPPSEAAAREILVERARQLARPLRAFLETTGEPVLRFALGSERFALTARFVFGTFRLHDFAPLPGAPSEIVGVAVWRGALLRVLDPRVILGLDRQGLDDRAHVIALGETAARIGLLVKSLDGVELLTGVTTPQHVEHGPRRFITHITADALQMVDAAALLRTFG
jgi:chemotaxis signal transduction protein